MQPASVLSKTWLEMELDNYGTVLNQTESIRQIIGFLLVVTLFFFLLFLILPAVIGVKTSFMMIYL